MAKTNDKGGGSNNTPRAAAGDAAGSTPNPNITPSGLPYDEQFSDILLIVDRQNSTVSALSELKPNEKDSKKQKFKTVPAKEDNENEFLKIDRHAGIIENFISNYWNQVKNPTHFAFFKMTIKEYKETRKALMDVAAGKDTDDLRRFLEKYEIKPRIGKQSLSDNHSINQNEKVMATQNQNATAGGEERKYRYNESMIDWNALKDYGISKEYLKESNLLDSMLMGYKTNRTVPVSMHMGSAVVRTDARLSFQQSIGGPVVLAVHGVRQEPELEKPFFGHIFSDEDKKNLRETGNMGRVVELKTRAGDYAPSIVSIDKLTNEVVAMRVENIFVPDDVKGVKLTDDEKQELREGKAVYIEGMTAKSGNEFSAHIQINADRRGIEFIFDNDKLYNRQSLGGVELSPKQIEDLNAGKAIFVEDMKRFGSDETFSSFVKLDEASGKPAYTRYNPDSPEGSREIYVPKVMNGVTLTPEDRDELRQGNPVFVENMTNRRGEEFSSFVKLDMETGNPSYSKTRDGFGQRAEFKIPAEVWGVTLSATQRACLQDGKSVLVEGMTGFDGNKFNSYLKVNQNRGRLDYYNDNPDIKRDASKRNVVAPAQEQAEKQDNKKSKGQKM